MKTKIQIDRIEAQPQHTLTRRDVQLVLSAVPAEWRAGLRTVRLSNFLRAREGASQIGASFNTWKGELTVYARGMNPRWVLQEMLCELLEAAERRRTPFPSSYRARRERAGLRRRVAAYVQYLAPQLQNAQPHRFMTPKVTWRSVAWHTLQEVRYEGQGPTLLHHPLPTGLCPPPNISW